MLRFCIASALSLAPVFAIAAESRWVQAGIEHPECTCRSRGADLALGSRICMPTPEGLRMAECVMEQNVTSWRASGQPCPQARLQSPRAAN